MLETFENEYSNLEEIPNDEEESDSEDENEEESIEDESDENEDIDSKPIGTELYRGIFRYNSFKSKTTYNIPLSTPQASPFGYDIQESCNILKYDWNTANRYSLNSKTLFGKLFSHFFGSNRRHHAYYPGNRRLRAGLYSYKYIFYSESGISAKFQKKKIFWTRVDAEELFIGWKNIVLKTPYKGTIPAPIKTKMKQPSIVVNSTVEIRPILRDKGKVVCITGLNLTKDQIHQIVNLYPNRVANYLSELMGGKVSLSDNTCFYLFSDDGIYTIVTGGGKFKQNRGRLLQVFHQENVFSTGKLNLNVVPGWSDVWNVLQASFKNRAQTEIIAGEACAVCYNNGTTKGMIFEKN